MAEDIYNPKNPDLFIQHELPPAEPPALNIVPLAEGLSVLDKGDFQSKNFRTGRAGYRLREDGTLEARQGEFSGKFELGGTLISIADMNDLDDAISELTVLGGGTISLVPNSYSRSSNIVLPSGVTLDGNGSTIDFGGGAFQVLIQGSNPYSTGTISVNYNSNTVTGVGTTWTAAMVGQSILLGDFWYTITARASNTSITINQGFLGTNLSGDTYVIATIVSGVTIQNLTVQNSSISLIKGRYTDAPSINGVSALSGDIGFDFTDSANVGFFSFFAQSCTTLGLSLNNAPFSTIQNFAILNTGMSLTRVSNTGISVGSFQAVTGVAIKFTNCYNIGLINYSIIEATSHGVEFVSGNNDIDVLGGYVNTCGGDGIKLTATTDRINITENSILNNTGYGVNIAASTCDNNTLVSNSFTNNTSGNLNNSGTNTKASANQGVTDVPASSSSTPSLSFSTIFESSTRIGGGHTPINSGSVAFTNAGGVIDTGATLGSAADIELDFDTLSAGSNINLGSPTICIGVGCSFSSNASAAGSAFFGIGFGGSNAGAGINFTINHAGFKVLVVAGVATLYATQSDGATETASSALTTLTSGDILDLSFKINGTASIDYYWRKNGGTLSAATNLSSHLPANTNSFSFRVANNSTAFDHIVNMLSLYYQR